MTSTPGVFSWINAGRGETAPGAQSKRKRPESASPMGGPDASKAAPTRAIGDTKSRPETRGWTKAIEVLEVMGTVRFLTCPSPGGHLSYADCKYLTPKTQMLIVRILLEVRRPAPLLPNRALAVGRRARAPKGCFAKDAGVEHF